MTMAPIVVAVGVIAVAVAGFRKFRVDEIRRLRKAVPEPVAPQPATYFERYLPKRTSGQGEPI